jgi:subtilase family serine protease
LIKYPKEEAMKSLFALSTCMLLVLAVPPVVAQAPDISHMYAHTPLRFSDLPQNTSVAFGIYPAQFKAAYGFNQIANQGQGQTIAVVDADNDPYIETDVAFYLSYFHLPACNFQVVQVGNPLNSPVWALEMSLDMEQVCMLAPQANIILVEANSQSLADLFAAVQVAYSAPYNATVISMSWDYPEFSGESSYDSYLCNITNGNGQPVTFVVATGDNLGENLLYPGDSKCVISAGGTDLILSTPLPPPNPTQLDYGVETAWYGTSGGVSLYEAQMPWQNPACATWSTTNRCVPDISSVASDIPVYDTYFYGPWINVSGTSIATPDWASFFTLVNSMRVSQDKPLLSQAAQDLYTIYYSSNYLTDFHDVTMGSDGNCGSECDAGPGYDLATGIGSYQANNLITALVAEPN